MIRLFQQALKNPHDDNNNLWEDLTVPKEATTRDDIVSDLITHGIVGEYRVAEEEGASDFHKIPLTVFYRFKIVRRDVYECIDISTD